MLAVTKPSVANTKPVDGKVRAEAQKYLEGNKTTKGRRRES